MFTNRPAMKFCFPLIFGIILGWQLSFSILTIGIAIFSLLVLYALIHVFKLGSQFTTILTFLLIIFFGIFKITYDGKYRSNDNISRFVDAGKTVTLKGTISDLPRLSEQSVRLIVDAESITINHQTYKVSGGVSVSILRRDVDVGVLSSLTLGRFIHFTGELGTINIGRNPGEFDLRNYLHLNNIYARFYPVRLDSSCLGEEMGNIVLTRFIYPVRRSIADRLDKLIGERKRNF